MKTMKNWFGKFENAYLFAGSLFFITAMIDLFLSNKNAATVISMVLSCVASILFFYLAIDYARLSDTTLQEKKFPWGLSIFGMVVMITASVCGLLFHSAFGNIVEWIVKMICVVFSTFGAIVVVYVLKRIH